MVLSASTIAPPAGVPAVPEERKGGLGRASAGSTTLEEVFEAWQKNGHAPRSVVDGIASLVCVPPWAPM